MDGIEAFHKHFPDYRISRGIEHFGSRMGAIKEKVEAFWSNPNADYDEKKMNELMDTMEIESEREAKSQWENKDGGEPWNPDQKDFDQLIRTIFDQKINQLDPERAEDFAKFQKHLKMQEEKSLEKIEKKLEWLEKDVPKLFKRKVEICQEIDRIYAQGWFDDETPSEKKERIQGYEAKSLEHYLEMTKNDVSMRSAKKTGEK